MDFACNYFVFRPMGEMHQKLVIQNNIVTANYTSEITSNNVIDSCLVERWYPKVASLEVPGSNFTAATSSLGILGKASLSQLPSPLLTTYNMGIINIY